VGLNYGGGRRDAVGNLDSGLRGRAERIDDWLLNFCDLEGIEDVGDLFVVEEREFVEGCFSKFLGQRRKPTCVELS